MSCRPSEVIQDTKGAEISQNPETGPCRATHEFPFKCVVPKTPDPKFLKYSLVINGQSRSLSPEAKIPRIPHNFFRLIILSKPSKELDSLLAKNLFLTEIELSENFGSGPVERYYWETQPERWSFLIERRHSPLPLADFLQTPWINESWNRVLEQKGVRQVEFFTRDGCAGHCVIKTIHAPTQTHRIVEINEYVGGLSIRHQVMIEERSKILLEAKYALIEIDPAGSPNLIYIFDQNLTIFSRTGEVLSTKPWQHLGKQPIDELPIRDNHKNRGKNSVIICDIGVLPSEISNFRVGPRIDKSYWGWISPLEEESELGLWEQLSGVFYLSDINHGFDHGNVFINGHHELIARLATDNTDISVISMSADQCFSHYKQWKNNALPYARVVNVSSSFSYDFESCEHESRFKDSIGDPEQPFLWVVPSGNEYKKNLIAHKTYYCPQSLGPRDNMIVVSAKGADFSNEGVDYSDIAADGPNGTSFAAPRVARVAAILAEEFPSLTIAQIKKAIMLGARIPIPRLVNRSGGILDEKGARHIAKQLAHR